MKNFFKQLGKSVCYFLLFFGMQLAIFTVFEVFYIFREAVVLAVSGEMYDVEAITEGALNFMMESTNIVSIISGCLTIFILWIFFLIRKKKLFVETNISKLSGKYIPLIIILGIAFATTISFGLNLLPESMLEVYGENVQVAIGDSVVLMVLSNMIMAPVVEEIIFRGLILSRLKKAVPPIWAVLISSLIFGLAHGQIVWITYAFMLGVVCAIVELKTESLVASILLHMAFNICGVVIPTLCSDITSNVVCVIMTAIGAVATAVLLTVILKKKQAVNETLQTV